MLLEWMLKTMMETPPDVVVGALGRMSLQGAVLIAVLLALRGVFARRVTPVAVYALWLIPAARLLVPGSIASAFSFLNLLPVFGQPDAATAVQVAEENTAVWELVPGQEITFIEGTAWKEAVVSDTVLEMDVVPSWGAVPIESAADPILNAPSYYAFSGALLAVWMLGAAAVIAFAVWRNAAFLRRVERDAVALDLDCPLPVYLSESVSSPCLCGVFHPVILVSDAVVQKDAYLEMALRHELAHYRAGDRYWALLRLTCCAVHWFNPLVWLAAAVSVQDCECACDWRVLRNADQEERETYGLALLRCLRQPAARYQLLSLTSPMGGGKRSLRRRITFIAAGAGAKRTASAALAACVALTCLVACTGRTEKNNTLQETERLGTEYKHALTDEAALLDEGMQRAGVITMVLCSLPEEMEDGVRYEMDSEVSGMVSVDCSLYSGGGMAMTNSGTAMGRQLHYLFRTGDGGETWTYVPSDINDVWARVSEEFYFVTADVGFVSFRAEIDDPMLLRTGDGGKTWQRVVLPMGGITYDNGYGAIHVTDIEFTDEKNGMVTVSMTYDGKDLSCQFYTDDGGLTFYAIGSHPAIPAEE